MLPIAISDTVQQTVIPTIMKMAENIIEEEIRAYRMRVNTRLIGLTVDVKKMLEVECVTDPTLGGEIKINFILKVGETE